MSVTNGNTADASTFNGAFMSKTAESSTTGKQNLANADSASGATVTNVQREVNSLNSFTGRSSGSVYNAKPTWSSNDVGVSTDDLKTRVDLLTALFNNLSGHDHSVGTTGKGGAIVAASATVIGAVNLLAQSFAGVKTFQDGLTSSNTFTASQASILNGIVKIAQTVDSSSTGANVDLSTPTTVYHKFTNASLTSLRTIVAPSTQGQILVLTNAVGGIIDIKNETGTTAADRIITGTGADLSVANNASVFLIYDFGSSRWRVIGGTGGSVTLAAGAVYSNGTVLASEAQLDRTRGGTGVSSTATFPTSGVIVTETSTNTLTNKTLTTPVTDIVSLTNQGSTPSTPSAGTTKFYAKSDDKVYRLTSAGVETEVGAAVGAVPVGTIMAWIGGYFGNGSNGSFTNVLGNTVANVNTLLNASGFYVCDGAALNNGSSPIFNGASRFLPNLTDSRFMMGSTSAGSTGGSNTMAHTHSVTSNVSVANHSDHTHSSGNFQAALSYSASHIRVKVNATAGFTADYKVTATGIAGSADSTSVSDAIDVQGDSGGSNSTLTHSVTNNAVTSGAASNDENRPLYISCFYIMRVV